ncbi:MAG: OadG family protein [Deltaproteobacteria bacterium]|nr:OadG family protein [Deltaproteobacteria bacterium]
MYGFDNIAANNGWAMAVIGASIVFAGLVVLSFVISQIHKILELWEKRDVLKERRKEESPADKTQKIQGPVYKAPHLPAVNDLISIYRPLVEQLKEPFELSQLFVISNKMDLAHPHLSIKQLWEADVLIAQGDGTFTWNKQKGN